MEERVIPESLMQFILENVLFQLHIEEPKELPDTASEEEQAKYQKELKEYEDLVELIKFYINKTCQEIIIRTNRNEFPLDLRYLVVDMIVNIYQNNSTNINSEDNQQIQSMSETGRSVSYGISDVVKIKYQLLIKQELENNNTLINRYRLLYKARCPKSEED